MSKNLLTDAIETEFIINHAEADTVLLTLYNQLRINEYDGAVIIDSEDTDVYVQAAYVSNMVEGQLLIKRKKVYVDCRTFLPRDVSEIIIPLHVMTGCDHNCGFYGRGKKMVIEKTIKSSEARNLLSECGDTLPIQQNVLDDLKRFVLRYIYGSSEVTCADARAQQWNGMKKKNTQRLVPDEDTLELVCKRANYLSYCQKKFYMKVHPSPIGNGWGIINGKCRPVRNCLPALPINTISEHYNSSGSSESEDSDNEPSSSSDSELDE